MIQNKVLRITTGCQQKSAMSLLRAEIAVLVPTWWCTWICVHSSFMLAPSSPCTPVISSTPPLPDSSPLKPASQVRGDDPNAPPVIFGGVLEEGNYPLTILTIQPQGWMVREIIWSKMPNKVLWAVLPPVDWAEQLLPQSYGCALYQLCSSYCLRLQSYHWRPQMPRRWPHGGSHLHLWPVSHI